MKRGKNSFQSFLKGISLFLLLLSFPLFGATYKVYYSLLPAGKIEISVKNDKVVVTGKSEGFVSWFYKYKLYMVYDLRNETRSFLKEEEKGKKKEYDFERIMKKKPWLPLVVKLLLQSGEVPPEIKVGKLTVKLEKVEGTTYAFKVSGSKKVKRVILKGWKPGYYPLQIEIETKDGTIKLVKR